MDERIQRMQEQIQKAVKNGILRDSDDSAAWIEEERKRREMWEEKRRQIEERRRLMWLREHSIEGFLQDPMDVCFDPEGCISTQRLYSIYKEWCREQQILEQTPRSFSLFLKQNTARYNIVYSGNITGPQGGHVRGYRGLREKTREERDAQYR